MKPETNSKIKFGIWGLVFGAVIATIIGFGWGGWSTAGSTQTASEKAVLASQAGVCFGQFVQDGNYAENVKEFKAADQWDRSKFVEKGGWDIMPGQEKADYGVARACADRIQDSLTK